MSIPKDKKYCLYEEGHICENMKIERDSLARGFMPSYCEKYKCRINDYEKCAPCKKDTLEKQADA